MWKRIIKSINLEKWIDIAIEENKKSLPTQQNLFREKYSVSTEAHFEIAETFLDACEA